MFETLKILYLEDEALVAIDTSEHLKSLGFEAVKVASRLDQAKRFTEETQFDLALLDINVDRGQNSLELGRMLKDGGTAVIFASGNSRVLGSLDNDGYGYLDKPFSLADLTAKLKAAVREHVKAAV